ncbi:MAG: hypothetical protein NXY57DRAFT_1011375 [Lentinula lateritia]|nr:MAG: hypothetical protein NXY57DRAFT_1011375 [Lentinula lateritia]
MGLISITAVRFFTGSLVLFFATSLSPRGRTLESKLLKITCPNLCWHIKTYEANIWSLKFWSSKQVSICRSECISCKIYCDVHDVHKLPNNQILNIMLEIMDHHLMHSIFRQSLPLLVLRNPLPVPQTVLRCLLFDS